MMDLRPETLLRATLGERMQLSYVVSDLDAAMDFWTGRLGVGPFVVIENAADDRVVAYRGSRTKVKMSLAFSYVDETQIEIIAAESNAPSPWTDFIRSGREGLHHLGFWPDDYEASCRRVEGMGFQRECTIETTDGAVSSNYFSGPSHFGVWLELAPNSAARRQYFGGVKALVERWDGSRPVRRYRSREAFIASGDSPA